MHIYFNFSILGPSVCSLRRLLDLTALKRHAYLAYQTQPLPDSCHATRIAIHPDDMPSSPTSHMPAMKEAMRIEPAPSSHGKGKRRGTRGRFEKICANQT